MKMESCHRYDFDELNINLGKFNLKGKTVLIPEMNRIAAHLFAANFRGFGVKAKVLETDGGCNLGKQFTSGKECYPCQITLGDILNFVKKEESNRGEFKPDNYAYFLPEAEGPCRFGMYNKYQRIVLNSIPKLNKLKIVSLTAEDGYSLDGILDKDRVTDFRKAGYFSLVIADIMDLLTWRVRPYEREKGLTDKFMEEAMHSMENLFERYGYRCFFDKILDKLVEITKGAKEIIDPDIPQKPLVGVVGEIFLRMHTGANQDLILLLEKHGAEVVNASFAEWVNYITYNKLREARQAFRFNFRKFNLKGLLACLMDIADFGSTLFYQEFIQKNTYRKTTKIIDIVQDHKISHLRNILEKNDLYSFQLTTETCISLAAILEHIRMGFNGIVNVYPLTCMPGMATSAIIRPAINENRIPYLDAPFDGTFQPGMEAAVRTFVYQAEEHFHQRGRYRETKRVNSHSPGASCYRYLSGNS